jgi:hypothetical protein
MSQLSDYAENALFSHLLRNVAYTSPAAVYLALYTASPTDADSGTEVSGGSYARQAITFGAPSNGVGTNSALITFPTATASWGVVTHFGIRDNVAGGNLLIWGALTNQKTVDIDDTVKVNIGDLSVTFA